MQIGHRLFQIILVVSLISLFCLSCDDEPGGDSSDTDVDTDTDSDIDTDTDSDTDSDVDSDTDTDSDADTGTGTGNDDDCSVDDIQVQRIYDDIAYLSSDDCAGRAPGTPGGELALVYVEDIYEAAGLTPMGDSGTYRQAFTSYHYELDGRPSLTINGNDFKAFREFRVIQGSGSGEIDGALVNAGNGLVIPSFDRGKYPKCPFDTEGYNDFKKLGDLSDKVVLVIENERRDVMANCPSEPTVCPQNNCLGDVGYKSALARKQGAKSILFAHANPAVAISQRNHVITEAYYRSDFPAAVVAFDSLDAALGSLSNQNSVSRARLSIKNKRTKATTHNLLGSIEGVDPVLKDEVVIIGGHIDHVGSPGGQIHPGADDNASGTSVVNELIRVLVECDFEPKRTILFAAWNAEEQGLVGSNYYVSHPAYPINDTVAYLNMDMEGQGDQDVVTLYDADTWVRDLVISASQQAGLTYQFQSGPMDWSNSSDHASFQSGGVSALFQMSGTGVNNHFGTHTPEDNITNISTESLKMSTDVALVSFIALAMGASQ